VPLNATLVVELDEALDPLAPGARSVRLEDLDGRAQPAEVAVEGGRLVVRPCVGPAELARPAAGWRLRLAGAPSPLALRTLGGRRLERGYALEVAVDPGLADDSGRAPRLVAVQGRAPQALAEVDAEGRVVLVFDGVLDPRALRPQDCPLRPLEGGLALDPVEPELDWSCCGRRFELRLRPPAGRGPLLLDLRRSGLRGLDGRAVDPPLAIELR